MRFNILVVLGVCAILLSACTSEAYKSGYDDGYREAEMIHETDYSDGYDDGFDCGYDSGYDDGYSEGYSDGYSENEEEVNFWREYAVIVTSTGKKYHTYDCYHIDGRRFQILNIASAKARGYAACLDCIGY